MTEKVEHVPFEPFEFPEDRYASEIHPLVEKLTEACDKAGLPYVIAIQHSIKEEGEFYSGKMGTAINVHSKNVLAEMLAMGHIADSDAANVITKMAVRSAGSYLAFLRDPEAVAEHNANLDKENPESPTKVH